MSNFSTDEWSSLIGKKVVSDTGNIYKVVSFARRPSVHLENEKGNCLDFCVGSLMGHGWEIYEEPFETLKDIGFEDCGRFVSDALVRDKLKRKAIKRIEELNKNYQNENSNNSIYEQGLLARGEIEGLKKFCNITEEDLMTQEEINARENGEVGNN